MPSSFDPILTVDAQAAIVRDLILSQPLRPVTSGVTGVILGAGLGRRMDNLGRLLPKPLLPVLNCSLLNWSLARMHSYGIRNIIVNTHHNCDLFESLPSMVSDLGVKLDLRKEDVLSGPFGGVLTCSRAARKTDDLLVLTGDGMFEVEIESLLDAHRRTDSELTMGVASVADGSRYGVLEVAADGAVVAMQEKPAGIGQVDTASCGIYFVAPRLIDRMNRNVLPLDWIDVVEVALSEGRRVSATLIEGWMDAGTPADLLTINLTMLSPTKLALVAKSMATAGGSVWLQGSVYGLDTALLKGTVLIGDGAILGPGAKLVNSIVGSKGTIGPNAEVRNSVVLPGATIAANATVVDVVVG